LTTMKSSRRHERTTRPTTDRTNPTSSSIVHGASDVRTFGEPERFESADVGRMRFAVVEAFADLDD
jgi:hypothetical protein